jgi:hypothetical protein
MSAALYQTGGLIVRRNAYKSIFFVYTAYSNGYTDQYIRCSGEI